MAQSRRSFLAVLLAMVPLRVVGAQPSPPPNLDAEALRGRWRLRGSVANAERRRDAAIERATDDMSIFTRGIARRRLRRGAPIHRTLRFSGTGASFLAAVGVYELRFAPDGVAHDYTEPVGDTELRASQRFRGRRLVQRMRSDGGTLIHTLQLSNNGQEITLTVRISSRHLPGDVVYRTRYSRVAS